MPAQLDYILDGQGYGEVASVLLNESDPGLRRPFVDRRGRKVVTLNTREIDPKTGKPKKKSFLVADLQARGIPVPVANATSLRKEEWIQMDQRVKLAARQRLRAWSDLAGVSSYGGFDGMSTMFLEHETMSDPGEALVDMDGLSEGRGDTPLFQLEGIPLPITHSDFSYSKRTLEVSRKNGTPLNMRQAEASARRVAEMVEKTLIGAVAGITYGSAASGAAGIAYGRAPTVYGYTNFPQRNTKTNITAPTGSNASATVADVLAMIDLSTADKFYGPWMLYHSNNWDQYMDNDYYVGTNTVPTQTLRSRLKAIDGIMDVRRLDFFTTANSLLLVQMNSDVAEAVTGMDITTVQWETLGGMRLHFKVMCIMVPRLYADYNGNCGIVHGTTS